MTKRDSYDAIIVGSGPNGLAAAITMARAGRSVLVIEGKDTIGGGMRSAQLTLPGFTHDVCSAVHPLANGSPFFNAVPLAECGLEWVHPTFPLAHPLDDGTAAVVQRSVDATATGLGRDAGAYRRLFGPLVTDAPKLIASLLAPPRPTRHLFALARFAVPAVLPATTLARRWFKTEPARAVFAGMAAHSILPLEKPGSAAFGLMLTMLAHAVGWPVARGGSQQIAEALGSYLCSLGGEIETGKFVESLDELPQTRAVLFDVTPRQLMRIAGDRMPDRYRRQMGRYRYGPGIFKVDFALDDPIPWTAEACRRAGTVHVGGTLDEITAAEAVAWRGQHPENPFLILSQPTIFDPTRAPEGKHTVWTYCHVPHGSNVDMSERIEAQIERFAPGFRDTIIDRHTYSAVDMEAYNPNYVGGDINGGVQDLRQHLARPVPRLNPYATPAQGIYICSSSTPPGGGVHGMCGTYAAQAALRAE